MSMKKSIVVEQLRKAQMVELLSRGKRLDGRGLLDHRDLIVEVNIIEKANGSAKVSLGHSQVVAGVKIEVGEPFLDTPDKGVLVVNAEVLPLASPYAEPGPPDEEAIELARVVDRGIRESQMIDLSKLVLIEGKKVYTIFVDVSVLNTDGNLFDASSYAAVSALITAKMPDFEVTSDGEVKPTGKFLPLPVKGLPVSLTFAKLGNVMVLDPTSEEEAIMDSRITLVVDESGNFCAGQKGMAGTLSLDQVAFVSQVALSRAKEIRERIKEIIGVA